MRLSDFIWSTNSIGKKDSGGGSGGGWNLMVHTQQSIAELPEEPEVIRILCEDLFGERLHLVSEEIPTLEQFENAYFLVGNGSVFFNNLKDPGINLEVNEETGIPIYVARDEDVYFAVFPEIWKEMFAMEGFDFTPGIYFGSKTFERDNVLLLAYPMVTK